MSFAGGLAASRAAVTGAGSGGLRDRFPTASAQLERLSYLKAQLHWYEAKKNHAAADEVRRQMRDIEALKSKPTAGAA